MSWQDEYRSKLTTPREAVNCVESGMRLFIHPGCAEPEALVEALMHRGPHVRDVEIVHILTLGRADYVAPEMEGHFRHNALFIGGNCRQAVNEGRADCTPIFLHEVEALFDTGAMPIDVCFIQVSPPDRHGYVSLGIGVEITMSAVKNAHYIVAQVNSEMPRTYGDTFIHVSKINAFVEVTQPLPELKKEVGGEVEDAIGRNIANLIDDGACLQLGIGGIPNAVLKNLTDRRDLGVHTEMVSDNVIPLIERDIINGRRKNFKPRKVILSFVLGNKRLFDFLHENPLFEFQPSSYTNDPWQIARNDNMVAINSALQVDLTGQVCSDSIGQRFYSGFGGQVDFIRGAARSKGGKPIIALPSTAKGGLISRISPMLTLGSGVVTTRADVHYVVTEYGVAYLHGKTVRERAQALIEIAHPNFRAELQEHCDRQRWTKRDAVACAGAR
ncbi:MAG TPA: acetyl-CoA hydrolase/transferase C-terminal domain-containing protein [Clostridia bacterium]|nr:acetyl-CoA hydrolase/transferase C-terminal domain-containing protein [Clostridia bacterium]